MSRNILDETIDIDSAVTDLVRAIDAISEDLNLWLSSYGSTLRRTTESPSDSGPAQEVGLTPDEGGSAEPPAGKAHLDKSLWRKVAGDLLAGCFVVIAIFIVMAVMG